MGWGVCVGMLCDVEEDIAKAVRPQSDPAVWKGKSGWGRVGVCVFVFRGVCCPTYDV